MLTLRILRGGACAIAIGALIDPVFATRRPQPITIQIRASSAPDGAIRDRLLSALGGAAVTGSGDTPAALVLIDEHPAAEDILAGRPVFIVTAPESHGPNVRVLDASPASAVLPGQNARFTAVFQGDGVAGKTTVFVLEEDGVELAREQHRWTSDQERHVVELVYAPPAAGIHAVRLRAIPLGEESAAGDNGADLPLVATSRILRIAAYEARPSWAAAFVRRALEADPVFDVSTIVRASRGLEVRGGTPPSVLSSVELERFDAVVVGAPEDLSSADVAALTWFVRSRGGALVFLPDRRPAGPYASMLPVSGFDEVLLDSPVAIPAEHSSGMKASELVLPRGVRGGAVLAAVPQGSAVRPVIVSWPYGAGRILFSGALDAWRYRARDDESFGRFWTGVIASLAAASPRPLTVSVHPPVAAPGERLMVRARVRGTEFSTGRDRVEIPAVEARLIANDGSARTLRLWPAAEAGVYEGSFAAPSAGRYDVQAKIGRGAEAHGAVLVLTGFRQPIAGDTDALPLVARATGGAVTTGADLRSVEGPLRALERGTASSQWRPSRSVWWTAAFAVALCAEWTLRRRKELR